MENHNRKLWDSNARPAAVAAATSPDRARDSDIWDNEGGATPSAASEPLRPWKRKREDTADGCRAMASADQARAGAAGSDNMRVQLQGSAQAWTDRADMFDHLDEKARARRDENLAAAADSTQTQEGID